MYISLWENSRGHPDNVSFMQFSTKIDGFEQKDSQGFENSYNSYEQYPLEKFFIFTIYQNYTLALNSVWYCALVTAHSYTRPRIYPSFLSLCFALASILALSLWFTLASILALPLCFVLASILALSLCFVPDSALASRLVSYPCFKGLQSSVEPCVLSSLLLLYSICVETSRFS